MALLREEHTDYLTGFQGPTPQDQDPTAGCTSGQPVVLPRMDSAIETLGGTTKDTPNPDRSQEPEGTPPPAVAARSDPRSPGARNSALRLSVQKREWRYDISATLHVVGRFQEGDRFEACGRVVRDYCPSCGHHVVETRVYSCDSRVCPECSRREAKLLYSEIMEVVKTLPKCPGWAWRHIICTTKRERGIPLSHDMEIVKRGLEGLKRYFRKKKFRVSINGKKVFGAVGGIEFGERTGMVHAHIMAYTPFLDNKEIEKAWGSGFIRIKLIESARQVENVCLYAVNFYGDKKPGEERKLPSPGFVVEVISALRRRRRVFTWGCLYNRLVREILEKTDRSCPICSGLLHWEFVRIDNPDSETGPPAICNGVHYV